MMQRDLEVVETMEDEARVIYARGELDLDGVPAMRERVGRSSRVRETILDLSGLTFIDTSGMAFLIDAQREAEASGRRLVLRNPSARIRSILRISGLLAHLRFSTE